MISPARALSLLLTVSALSACSDDSCPTMSVCDIRTSDCQHDILTAVSCMRGGSTKLPVVQVVNEAQLLERYTAADTRTDEQKLATERYTRGLSLFHLAPSDYSSESARKDSIAVTGAVYFNDTKEIWVIDRGTSLASAEMVELFAHEIVHALQDADFGLRAFRERWVRDYDSSLAISGLIEGEATHYQMRTAVQLEGVALRNVRWDAWFESWRSDQLRDAERDQAPVTLARMRFPYAFGGGFVTQHWLADGRAGIDALFDHPPLTTREIMFGAPPADTREQAEQLFESALPGLSGDNQLITGDSFGAWITRMYAARMNLSVSQRLVAARELLSDYFSVQANEETGNVTAAWRARLQSTNALGNWPGIYAASPTSWTDDSAHDVYQVASEGELSTPRELAWLSPEVAYPPSDEMTAALRWHGQGAAGDALPCNARRPSLQPFITK